MTWLARLKNPQAPDADPTEPTKPGFVGFVGTPDGHIQKITGDPAPANDPAPDQDRWAWPHSADMTGAELHAFTARLVPFTDRGLTVEDAERLADKLAWRDRESDDRRLCMECAHLAGHAVGSWACRAWQWARLAIRVGDSLLPGELVQILQRCNGFKAVTT